MTALERDNTNDDFSTREKALRKYHELGYNVIKILGKGKKYDRYENQEGKTILYRDTATGKSAAGTGKWTNWIDTKQKEDDFKKILESIGNEDNIGIIHGGVSQWLKVEIDDLDREKERPTGSFVIECDGEGANLFWEMVLMMSNQNFRRKLLNTMRVRTPSGGIHWYCRYYKEYSKQTGEEIKISNKITNMKLYSGEGHNEIVLLADGKYTVGPPSNIGNNKYEIEKHVNSNNDMAILTIGEITSIANSIKRTDKRITKGQVWTDKENYQDLNNDQETRYSLVSVGKILYKVARTKNERHNTTLAYTGILKRYHKLTEADNYKVIESLEPGDRKNQDAVKSTYRKKDNEITSMNTFRKLVIGLLGEDQGSEIMDELLSMTVPERSFYSNKPDGKLLELAVDNVEKCFSDQNNLGYALIYTKKTDSYQIVELGSEDLVNAY